jgi:hypothetical protein
LLTKINSSDSREVSGLTSGLINVLPSAPENGKLAVLPLYFYPRIGLFLDIPNLLLPLFLQTGAFTAMLAFPIQSLRL